MMKPFILKAILVFTLFSTTYIINAQDNSAKSSEVTIKPSTKPYRVLTNGKQITIQSKQNIKSLMAWTSSGHRIVEEKEINNTNYSFNVPSKEKLVFIMTEMSDGKRFTEKIGVK
jgi:hypothetical protein